MSLCFNSPISFSPFVFSPNRRGVQSGQGRQAARSRRLQDPPELVVHGPDHADPAPLLDARLQPSPRVRLLHLWLCVDTGHHRESHHRHEGRAEGGGARRLRTRVSLPVLHQRYVSLGWGESDF